MYMKNEQINTLTQYQRFFEASISTNLKHYFDRYKKSRK